MSEVIVSGMGVLSTAGFELDEFWNNLLACKKYYGEIEEFVNDKNYRIKIGARLKSEEWKKSLPASLLEKYGRAACYSARTVQKAIVDAGIDLDSIPKERIAVIMGTTMGEISVEEEITRLKCAGKEVDRTLYQKYPANNIVAAIQEITGARGNCFVVPAACAAGNYAVSIGKKMLEWNEADVVIAGGVDVFSLTAFAGFQRLLSLDPVHCRPFDKKRRGLVVGEGCGIVVMERDGERSHKQIYGKILGAGLSSDAYHMTALDKSGCGEERTMTKALESASLSAKDIHYISAHGTGTKLNDHVESKAIANVFHSCQTPVSSTKSLIGHSMGAASMLELISSFLMLREQIILPTINWEEPDEDLEINHIANTPQKANLQYIMSNSFAFGGQSSSLVIGR